MRGWLIWAAVVASIAVPLLLAAQSPLLAWRQGIYIASGFAGIIGMGALLLQPLLVGGYLPGVGPRRTRVWHGRVGVGLVLCVLAHVVGLWLTSPPDVVDALLLVSPTPFSAWGVIAMWAVLATALLARLRRRLRPRVWRVAHAVFALIIGGGSVVHAMLVDGTMEPVSKAALCLLVLIATLRVAGERLRLR